MEIGTIIQSFLDDFVFRNRRLAESDILRVAVFWKKGSIGEWGETTPSIPSFTAEQFVQPWTISGLDFFRDHKQNVGDRYDVFSVSFLDVPLYSGARLYTGVIGILSTKVGVLACEFLDNISRVSPFEGQWLTTFLSSIISYLYFLHMGSNLQISTTWMTLSVLLTATRKRINASPQVLSSLMGLPVASFQNMEGGRECPDSDTLRSWLVNLGLLEEKGNLIIRVVDITGVLIQLLREFPDQISQLSAEQFELLIANRIERMGFNVTLTGAWNRKDGGIDLIATPKNLGLGSYLLAGQVKHHKQEHKTGAQAVRDLLAWKDSVFRLGLLVTNTTFTHDAKWVAAVRDKSSFLRLRDFNDIRRWLCDVFTFESEWREIPDEVELAPGIRVRVPKPQPG